MHCFSDNMSKIKGRVKIKGDLLAPNQSQFVCDEGSLICHQMPEICFYFYPLKFSERKLLVGWLAVT